MNREYHKWHSPCLDREMELLVFGHSGARVLVFPTRGGRFYEYENLRMVEVLRPKIENGALQLFCLDGLDSESVYCFWAHPAGRVARLMQYEAYVLQEVFPFMENVSPGAPTISHGCSLGAFHAVNIALRHPERFAKICAFSGRYDLTLNVENFRNQFDGYYDRDIYLNTPTHFLSNLDDPEILGQMRRLDIVLTIGKQDPFLENNRHLSHLLWTKGVANTLHEWDERAHSGYYWRRMAPLYL